MAVVLKYTQSTYDAKITELEGYLSQLQDHYDRLEALKADMYNFWNDDNSIKAGEALTTTMRQQRSLSMIHRIQGDLRYMLPQDSHGRTMVAAFM